MYDHHHDAGDRPGSTPPAVRSHRRRAAARAALAALGATAAGATLGVGPVQATAPSTLAPATVASASASPASSASSARLRHRYDQEIVNHYSGLRARVRGASTASYQGLWLWPRSTSYAQRFDLLDSGNGYFRIRARHSGQCVMLDWRGGSYRDGTKVIQYPYCGSAYTPAEWRIRRLSGTTCSKGICTTGVDRYLLVNRRTGKCLDAANGRGGRPPIGAGLQQWRCVTSTKAWNIGNQAWDVHRYGTVRID